MNARAILAIAAALVATQASAAEPEPLSPRTHQLTVCLPDAPCERRGRPMGETACALDAASERLLAGLPKATKISCERIKQGD